MSHWNIAAAQYSGQHQSVDDHITHHLRFIAEAARQGCDLLVFPELSLTGSGTTTLPLPPGDAQLEPLLDAAHRYRITVIAGLPVERDGQRQKGLALFTPARQRILRYPQGGGASLVPGEKQLSIIDAHADSPISIPERRCLPAVSQWRITAGGSPSVPCSASRINMP